MPFSAESAQLRPFMVEGFLATLQRIDERCGSAVTLRALRYTYIAGICIAEPVIFPYEYVCLGYVRYIRSGRLYSMHKATARIHADMRLVSEMPVLPFLGLVRFKGRVYGRGSSWSSEPR